MLTEVQILYRKNSFFKKRILFIFLPVSQSILGNLLDILHVHQSLAYFLMLNEAVPQQTPETESIMMTHDINKHTKS